VDLLIQTSTKLIVAVTLIFFLSSCAHNKPINVLDKNNTSHEIIVEFANNKNTLDKKQENKVISFISSIKPNKDIAVRVWISPSHNAKKGSLNLSWIRIKRLYEAIYPFVDDIELFYDEKLNKDTALISISWG
jgi:type IV pilus biogenesis protein CpaD/CtpE